MKGLSRPMAGLDELLAFHAQRETKRGHGLGVPLIRLPEGALRLLFLSKVEAAVPPRRAADPWVPISGWQR